MRVAVAAYLAVLVGAAVVVQTLGDRWWPATALLFAPRWVLALPLMVLVPAALLTRRRLLAHLGAALLVLLVPVMGLQAPWPGVLVRRGERSDLRVMTYNTGGLARSSGALDAVLDAVRPDVAALQECEVDLERLRAGGWFVDTGRHLCVVSRFPIRRATGDRDDLRPEPDSGTAIAYVVASPAGPVTLLNVHLTTVRSGLEGVMRRAWRGAPDLRANSEIRRRESLIARDRAARLVPPPIVVGDFNIPVESAIYHEAWAAWTNAFSRAGLGFGFTKYTRWHGVRVDHVLHPPGWECVRAWVEPGAGDHRPVVADLARRRP